MIGLFIENSDSKNDTIFLCLVHFAKKYKILLFVFCTDILKTFTISDSHTSFKKHTLSPKDDQSKQKFLRSSLHNFNENKLCCICDEKKNKGCKKMSLGSDAKTIQNLLNVPESGNNLSMQRRFENVINLSESAAVFYHEKSYAKSLQRAAIIDTTVKNDTIEHEHEVSREADDSSIANVE